MLGRKGAISKSWTGQKENSQPPALDEIAGKEAAATEILLKENASNITKTAQAAHVSIVTHNAPYRTPKSKLDGLKRSVNKYTKKSNKDFYFSPYDHGQNNVCAHPSSNADFTNGSKRSMDTNTQDVKPNNSSPSTTATSSISITDLPFYTPDPGNEFWTEIVIDDTAKLVEGINEETTQQEHNLLYMASATSPPTTTILHGPQRKAHF